MLFNHKPFSAYTSPKQYVHLFLIWKSFQTCGHCC